MRTFHPVHGYSFLSQEAHQSTVWRAEIAPRSRREAAKSRLHRPMTRRPLIGATCRRSARPRGRRCTRHLPQNRDVFMTTGGNGSLELWKYSYPTQRSIQACNRSVEHAIMIIMCTSSATRAAPYRARTTDARGVTGPRRPREGRARLGDSAAEEDLLNAAEYAHATHHTCSFR